MNACAHCDRPIEPGQPLHRTPAGDFHGPCLGAATAAAEDLDARRRRAAVDRRDATETSRRRMLGDLVDGADPVRRF